MVRTAVFAVLATALAAPTVLADDAKKDDFLDPEQWTGLTKYWKIDGDTLIGDTEPDGLTFNTFLCSKKKFKDFELTFKIQLKGGVGNSGVQVRSEVFDTSRFAVKGPQCDIGQQYWGSLYGEHFGGMMKAAPKDKMEKVLKPDGFNDYEIRCVGKRVTIKLNGETMVDDEFDNMPEDGIIAWQLHSGPPMVVTFKEVRFKEITE